MAKRVQLRRGTTAEINAFTGAVGEVTVDTEKDVLVVHDGVTVGGFPVAARANANGTISLIKKDGTVIGSINATGLFNNTLTSTATDQALTAAQGKVLQDNKLDKTAITVSGSAPMYACRAWVNFDGINNNIRAGGNVSSVTDNGTGDYTINLTTPLQDQNYSIVAMIGQSSGNTDLFVCSIISINNSSVRINCRQGNKDFNADVDSNILSVAIFR